MIKFNGINHLAMVTGDMDKTIRFWRDLLGMRLVAGLGQPDYRHYFFQVSETDTIAFFEWPGIKPAEPKEHGRPVKGRFIFDHVAFGVDTEEELWPLKDRLTAAGFEVSREINHGFIHSIYTFDPNGIPIEFACPVEGVDIRENPTMKDLEPSEAALEGAEPILDKWPEVKEPTPPEQRKLYAGAGSELFQGIKKTDKE